MRPRTVRDTIVATLLNDLREGTLAPGDRLTEVAVAARSGHSRGIAREALKVLEQHGVLVILHGVGSTIAPESEWDLLNPELLEIALDAGEGPALLAEVVEAARLSALPAAELAAERATPATLERVQAAFEQLSTAHDTLAADAAFHAAVAAAAGNRVLASLLRPLRTGLRMLGTPDGVLPADAALNDALQAGDPAAARAAMASYLDAIG